MADTEFNLLYNNLAQIKKLLKGDGYFSIDDEDSITEVLPSYKSAGELIISSWNFVKSKGLDAFFSRSYEEHSMIGELVTILESYYYLMGEYENLYKVLSEELPFIDGKTFFIPFDTNINIYIAEISRYAKKNDEKRARTLYDALLNLRNNNLIIPNDITLLDELKNLWSERF